MYTSGKFLLGLTAIVGFAARSVMPYTIQEEGDACFEIAAAMPGLKNITDLPAGKTVWTSVKTTWPGRRNLVEKDNMNSLDFNGTFMALQSHESLMATLPSWCSFVGVKCDSVSGSLTYGRVNEISLISFSMKLGGTLPSSIGNFQSITNLEFQHTSISGTIPSNIGALTTLVLFGLGDNHFIGTIPPVISQLKSLTKFSLYLNSLNGTIPSVLGDLTSLETMYLNGNSLISSIPSSIGKMTSLKSLYLFSNRLTGTIPSTMSSLTLLKYLHLYNNYLTMGSAATVPTSTFSSYTLANVIKLETNCLAFDTIVPPRHVIVDHCLPTSSPTPRPTESPTFKPTQSPTISMAPTQTESPTISLSPTEFVSSSPVRSRVQATNSGQNNLKSSLLSLLLAIPISAAICLY